MILKGNGKNLRPRMAKTFPRQEQKVTQAKISKTSLMADITEHSQYPKTFKILY